MAAVLVVRTAIVAAYEEREPQVAEAVWAGHPDALRGSAMALVGSAAGRGENPPPAAMGRLDALAEAEPLAVEPFLVAAALAQRGGAFEEAERLLVHARRIAPRAPAARLLLADLHFRAGRVLPGLAEMSILGRLVPGGRQQVAPALAAYARTAGAVPHLRRILLVYPELEEPLLRELSDDPANAGLIVGIASGNDHSGKPPKWQSRLLDRMLAAGEFDEALLVWARLSGRDSGSGRGLTDPAFAGELAPPPFGWTLESSSRGVAEPDNGGLRVLSFGRDRVGLARQTMLLAPGPYRLSMRLDGRVVEDHGVQWTIRCLPAGEQILRLPLAKARSSGIAADFQVPGDCRAQAILLEAREADFPESADFRISGLKLERLGQ